MISAILTALDYAIQAIITILIIRKTLIITQKYVRGSKICIYRNDSQQLFYDSEFNCFKPSTNNNSTETFMDRFNNSCLNGSNPYYPTWWLLNGHLQTLYISGEVNNVELRR